MSGSALAAQPISPAQPEIALRRIEAVCDAGSFHPVRTGVQSARSRRTQPGDGVLAGSAEIQGRPVFVYAQDPSFLGGSLGEEHARSIVRVLQSARQSGVPTVGLIHSGGARLDDGAAALDGYGAIFSEHVRSSGWIPQVSVIYGTSAGGGCYSPALTDLVVMCSEASMFLTGPKVVAEVLGEEIGRDALGGASVQAANGVAQLVAEDERAAAEQVRRFLSYLPSNSDLEPPAYPPGPSPGADPAGPVPDSPRRVYDIREVAGAIVDEGSLLELAGGWARNLVVALARLGGRPVGIVANQPRHRGGVLDSGSAEKGAWFIELCDRFGLPLLVLEDTPGFVPGSREEGRGVIRHGAKLVRAFAKARVPRITIVIRKGFGGAFITMNSKALGADLVLAWPGAEIGIMASAQAVGITHGQVIAAAADPVAERDRLAAAYAAEHTGAAVAAAAGTIDELIEPAMTRDRLIAALAALGTRRRAR